MRWRGRASGPRAASLKAAGDETLTEQQALADRYEALRERVLGCGADGFRLGLGLLLSRGVAAWIAASRHAAPAAADPGAGDRGASAALAGGEERELVGVLAAMALACVESF